MFANTLTQQYENITGASLAVSFRVLRDNGAKLTRGCCFIFLFLGSLELKICYRVTQKQDSVLRDHNERQVVQEVLTGIGIK
jgi:hypothetical protein